MSFYHSPRIVTDKLIMCLDTGNTKSYTSGTTIWRDISNNGNVGTLTLGASGTYKGIALDGVDDTITTPVSLAALSASRDFTLEIWVSMSEYPQPTPTPNGYGRTDKLGILFGAGYYAGAGIYWNGNASGTVCTMASWTRTTVNSIYTSYYSMSIGIPQHLVMVNNASEGTLKMYVTGVLHSSVAKSSGEYNPTYVAVADPIGIARAQIDGGGTGNYSTFKGQVSVARIYTKALSAEEVLQNYNATKGRFGL